MMITAGLGASTVRSAATVLLAVLPLPILCGSDDVVAWLYPHLVPGTLDATYEYGYPEGGADGRPQELDRLQVDGQLRLYTGADQCAFVSAGYEDLSYPINLNLPDGRQVPRHLRSALAGGTWSTSDGVTTLGVHLDAGSASDQLFANGDTLVVDGTLFAKWPMNRDNSWVVFLNYDSNRPYLSRYPIPAIAIEHHPSPDFELMIGLPIFYLSWHPDPYFLIEASFVENANLDVYAYVSPKWSISASYAWYGQSFRLAHEPNQGGQIGFEDMRASLGISYDASTSITIRMLGGYLFDRYVYSGSSTSLVGSYHNARALPATPVVAFTFSID